MRSRRHTAVLLTIIIVVMVGIASYRAYVSSLNPVEHETDRWAVIEDVNQDRLAVEPTDNQIWFELVELQRNGTRMYIGGIVERYDNRWGFRFKPDTITVAQFTAEALQASLRLISSEIDYWVKLGYAYVAAKVVEVHSPS